MLAWLRSFIRKHWNVISYLFFGVLTTVVNYIVYLPLYNLLQVSATISNCIAWAAAVLFAYLTNKPFVYKSNDWSATNVLPELAKFIGCRAGSGLVETLFLLVTVDVLHVNGNAMKLLISVVVVVLNYVTGKLLVFRKKGEA